MVFKVRFFDKNEPIFFITITGFGSQNALVLLEPGTDFAKILMVYGTLKAPSFFKPFKSLLKPLLS
jgi:hypothetical protein